MSDSDELREAAFVARRQFLGDGCAELSKEQARLLIKAADDVERLTTLINTPVVDDWLEGVRIEGAHQQERWGAEHDRGKTAADWFWLLGYLGGKALAAAMQGNTDKAKHHTIS